MSGFLRDANVILEMTKRVPDPRVVAFLTKEHDLCLPVIVLYELEFGLQLLPMGRRRQDLEATLLAFTTEYENRILSAGRREAGCAATLQAMKRRAGRALDLGDALVAGTAKVHGLSVATRNTKDFDGLDVDVTNPWEP